MPEPIYTPTTERLYERLPEFLRLADRRNDWVMKRWLSSIVDRQGAVDTLLSRIDYYSVPDGGEFGDTSDLVDPLKADESWLPWLGQLVGVRVDPGLTLTEKRDAVRFASAGWRAGTKAAVADAAKSELTGERRSRVFDHSTATNIGGASEWDVLVVTRPSETPNPDAVLSAIIRKRAKPAGVVLHHRAYEAAWVDIHRALPTWADWRGKTWRTIQEAGI